MIKYDYILKRDEQDELKTFLPGEIGKQLPNLVYIVRWSPKTGQLVKVWFCF
jgi:hypothetical protein